MEFAMQVSLLYTSMHSSRMRTDRCSGRHCPGMGGLCPEGGLCPGGSPYRPPPGGQINASENSAFPFRW